MMKKIISVFTLIALVMSVFAGVKIERVLGDVEIRNIEVLPNTVDSFAQYNIYVVLHKDLNRGENLYVKFPSTYTLPQSINKELVEVAGSKPASVVVSNNTFILTLSDPVLQNQGAGSGGILVTFSSSVGIKTLLHLISIHLKCGLQLNQITLFIHFTLGLNLKVQQ